METNILKEQWQHMKVEIKKYWWRLSDSEIDQIDGEPTRLEKALHEKYGYTREQAGQKVVQFLNMYLPLNVSSNVG
ncbi:MAG: hypothetical protein L0Y56_10940 [Nitrospira sp.]|nr:hypothetical protein [Nitrospira sp.]